MRDFFSGEEVDNGSMNFIHIFPLVDSSFAVLTKDESLNDSGFRTSCVIAFTKWHKPSFCAFSFIAFMPFSE
jgi:hypothetical protein